jgi:hypothetical protein
MADLGDEWVLLQVRTGEYYTINDVGVRIFKHSRDGISYEELLDMLIQHYDVNKSRLEKDIKIFIEDMERFGLIDVRDPD